MPKVQTMSVATISPRELHALMAGGQRVDLIDVRTPLEFREVHAQSARSVPLDALDPARLAMDRHDRPLYVICRSGGRAKQACEKFITAGFPQVVNVEGGTLAWIDAELPVVRGKAGITLERQVRIAAGLLVLAGLVLGWLVHPGFFGLTAFVGTGLIYAGLTDRCGLGLLLARMPWNRRKTCGTAC
jgi:rhodanese-related sulfurtransferase